MFGGKMEEFKEFLKKFVSNFKIRRYFNIYNM